MKTLIIKNKLYVYNTIYEDSIILDDDKFMIQVD